MSRRTGCASKMAPLVVILDGDPDSPAGNESTYAIRASRKLLRVTWRELLYFFIYILNAPDNNRSLSGEDSIILQGDTLHLQLLMEQHPEQIEEYLG